MNHFLYSASHRLDVVALQVILRVLLVDSWVSSVPPRLGGRIMSFKCEPLLYVSFVVFVSER